MAGTRHLYLSRHGEADPFGELTVTGRAQARLLGERLALLPIDAVWHSPPPMPQSVLASSLLSYRATPLWLRLRSLVHDVRSAATDP